MYWAVFSCEVQACEWVHHTQSGLVHYYYQYNVLPSEVQLDIFCHENQHDFIYCFYIYVSSITEGVIRLVVSYPIWVVQPLFYLKHNLFFSTQSHEYTCSTMDTHKHSTGNKAHKHVHNHQWLTVNWKLNVRWLKWSLLIELGNCF